MAHAAPPYVVLVENALDGALRKLEWIWRRGIYDDECKFIYMEYGMVEYMLFAVGHTGAVDIMLG